MSINSSPSPLDYSLWLHNDNPIIRFSDNRNPSQLTSDERLHIATKLFSQTNNNRHSCSFFCRTWFNKINDKKNNRTYYHINIGKFGTCHRQCRSLIRPHEFAWHYFTISGRFAPNVYNVFHELSRKSFAIKTITSSNSQHHNTLSQKYNMLVNLQYNSPCTYIVPFLGTCNKNSLTLGIIMPRYQFTLFDHMKIKQFRLDQFTICNVGYSILKALAYLHSNNPVILHCNIKPSNIFGIFGHDDIILWSLADFSDAILFDNSDNGLLDKSLSQDTLGNTYYSLAPEQIMSFSSYCGTDIWHLGSLLYWLLIDSDSPPILHNIVLDPSFSNNIASMIFISKLPFLASIITNMLHPDVHKRPLANTLICDFYSLCDQANIFVHTCRCHCRSSHSFITFELDFLL